MIKTYAFIVKKAGLSDEQFHAHWRDPHGVMTARIPHFVRYLQNHGTGEECRFGSLPPVPFRGVPVIWTAGLEDLAAAAEHPEWPPLAADGGLFYDVDRLAFVPCQEGAELGHDPGTGPHHKAMIFFRVDGAVDQAQLLLQVTKAIPKAPWMGIACPLAAANPPPGPFFDMVLEVILPPGSGSLQEAAAHGHALVDTLTEFRALQPVGGFLCREERVFDRR